jgi:amino acid adenylation domain-containing protein
MHHIICDQITINYLLNDLSSFYQDLTIYKKSKFSISDYAAWENKFYKCKIVNDKEYWKNSVANWHFGNTIWNSAQENIKYLGKTFSVVLENSTLEKIKNTAKQNGITLHSLLLSLLSAFISRYFNKGDIVFSIPVSSREHAHAECMLGFFLNILPVFQKIDGKISFAEHANNTNKLIAEILSHRVMPFDEIKALMPQGFQSAIDAFVSFQDKRKEVLSLQGLNVLRKTVVMECIKFPLSFHFLLFDNHMEIQIEKSNSIGLFDFNGVLDNFVKFIDTAIENFHHSLHAVPFISPGQQENVKSLCSGSNIQLVNKNISEFLITSFLDNNDRIGLVVNGVEYSYREIHQTSLQIAEWIKNKNINGSVVIMMDKTEQSIFCCLGTMLAGCTYVPMTVDIPYNRLQDVIKTLNPGLVIFDKKHFSKTDFLSQCVDYHTLFSDLPLVTVESSSSIKINDDLYIIFTSGSTGTPKGILQSHRAIINLIEHMSKTVDSSITNVLQLASFNFDVSIQEMLFSLTTGKKLYLVVDQIKNEIKDLSNFINDNKINLAIFTPSHFMEFARYSNSKNQFHDELDIIYLSGEKLILSGPIKRFMGRNSHIKLYNQYGPTETHVATEFLIINDNNNVPIGKPIPNTRLYVVNPQLEVLPAGSIGELCIAGHGVSNGYIGVDSNKSFFKNKFDEEVIYKTGDLVRLLPDGNMDYIRRNDRQIKLRGFRIELSDVELAIAKHPNALSSAALIKYHDSNAFLVAFYTCSSENSIHEAEMRKFLFKHIPKYMIPNILIATDHLPLSPNGKIDYKKLKALIPCQENSDYITDDHYSETISRIWRSVLNMPVRISDDFFDLGGFSLAAAQVVSNISELFDIDLAASALFQYSKLHEFVNYVKQIHLERKVCIAVDSKSISCNSLIPLSNFQKRIWLAASCTHDSAYNLPIVFNIQGLIDTNKLNETINYLIKRHDILRTKFTNDADGNVHQIISNSQEASQFVIYECSDDEFESRLDKIIHNQFDLSKDLLIRSCLLCSATRSSLIIVLHHIICDGRSIELLLADIEELYGVTESKIDLDIHPNFSDYTLHKNSVLHQDELTKQNYWLHKINNFIPINLDSNLISLPKTDHKYGISRYTLTLNNMQSNLKIHPFAMVLSAFSIVARKITGKSKFNLLTVIDESLFYESPNIIGPLLNLAILQFEIDEQEAVSTLINRVNKELITSLKHSDYQMDEILNGISLDTKNKIFDTCIIYHYYHLKNQLALGDAILQRQSVHCRGLKNPFSINIYPKENNIELIVEYDQEQYDKLFIDGVINALNNVLFQVCSNQDTLISDISLLSKREINKLLIDHNQTATDYPRDKNLFDLVSENCEPEKTAIYCVDQSLSYRELENSVSLIEKHIAKILSFKSSNVKIAAIFLDRKPHTIAAILALIKSGISYFPIDNRFPDSRILKMLEDLNLFL